MFQLFGDIPGVIVYFDDLAVIAENEREHDEILEKVLNRPRKNNVKFNPEKLQYKKSTMRFMGHYYRVHIRTRRSRIRGCKGGTNF